MSHRSLTSKLAQASATVKQVAAFIGPDCLDDINCDFGEYTQPMPGKTRRLRLVADRGMPVDSREA